jgi:hypothetical protein
VRESPDLRDFYILAAGVGQEHPQKWRGHKLDRTYYCS